MWENGKKYPTLVSIIDYFIQKMEAKIKKSAVGKLFQLLIWDTRNLFSHCCRWHANVGVVQLKMSVDLLMTKLIAFRWQII